MTIPTHDGLVAAARAYAPSHLPVLASVPGEQLAGRDRDGRPRPCIGALLARKCLAYSNQHRSGVLTDDKLTRLGLLGLTLADPVLTDTTDAALDSMLVLVGG
jgi:hypothetical protein